MNKIKISKELYMAIFSLLLFGFIIFGFLSIYIGSKSYVEDVGVVEINKIGGNEIEQ